MFINRMSIKQSQYITIQVNFIEKVLNQRSQPDTEDYKIYYSIYLKFRYRQNESMVSGFWYRIPREHYYFKIEIFCYFF